MPYQSFTHTQMPPLIHKAAINQIEPADLIITVHKACLSHSSAICGNSACPYFCPPCVMQLQLPTGGNKA